MLARAAVAIAAVTVLARVVGFGRTAVLARAVGTSCLGDVYSTANLVPNIIFEVVAGGALASLVVPLLAGPVAAADLAITRRTAGALLGWAVLLLTPLAVVGALLARPLMGLLLGHGGASGSCPRPDEVALGARMLVVFMPQVVLYGIGIVLTGVLQAHRRFLGPALAPLLSSLVVVLAYLVFAALAGDSGEELGALPRSHELVLSVGTTLGVVVLSLGLLVPLRRLGLHLSLTLSFPPGVARRVRRLALAGTAGLVAQQLSVVVVLRLANDGAPPGSVVVYQLASAVFLVPWAVLAVPVATSVFPALSAHAAAADERSYAATAAGATRTVVLLTLAAAGVLAAAAVPVARALALHVPGTPSTQALARALLAFAPGLVGYGLLALLGRALYARGDGRTPATATVVGWLAVVAADVALVRVLPGGSRVAALALGNTVGMSVAGVLLARGLLRAAGPAALAGVGRVAGAGGLGALAGASAGALLARVVGPHGALASLVTATVVGLLSLVVFALVGSAVAGRPVWALGGRHRHG